MSCWVVPSVAAELWGVPLANVLENIRTGSILSKDENGFTFVDVASDGELCKSPEQVRPTTFAPANLTVVTESELVALASDNGLKIDSGDWREARKLASRTRKPPVTLPDRI